MNESLCEQICINTNGGYFCSCWDGYNLIEGTNQCEGNCNESYCRNALQ